MRERIGVIGAGRMGLLIVRRLRGAGFEVTVADAVEGRRDAARDAGAAIGRSAQDVAAAVDVLITVLPGPTEVREVMLGVATTDAVAITDAVATTDAAATAASTSEPSAAAPADAETESRAGAISAMRPGTVWLDLSSNDPRVATEIAEAAAEHGVLSVGAPMGGGPTDAAAGTIRFHVGGAPDAVARIEPILEHLSRPGGIVRLGPDIAAGFTAKLLVNLLWFGQAVAVTEAMLLGQRLGIAPALFRDLLPGSAGESAFTTGSLDALLDGDDLATFGIDRVVEELDALVALADAEGTPFELSTLVTRLHREALDRFGPIDGELLAARLLEDRAGAVLRAPVGGGTATEIVEPLAG
ncbi:NAD(P)-dependent oxidoreductase [Plantibacter sp. YIM 135249]|uniref:NAD(P)-dependent oxidoreductase n=1 Tax=Plantibacter sp. YIM 135249 TaxID=3423918 RepID=UPI003D32F137